MTAIAMSAGTAKTEGLGATPASAVPKAIAQLLANQESRNSWLYTTGEQARKLNEESKGDDDGSR